jgi:TonB family protein
VMRAGTIRDSFYSNDARKAKIEGRATVGFTVDASGMPVDCRTLISSRSERLDAQTCKMTETFRFKPAVDLSGRPVPEKFVFFDRVDDAEEFAGVWSRSGSRPRRN